MQDAAQVPTKSFLRYLIEAGGPQGFMLILMSMALILWGLVNLAFVKNRWALLLQALASFVPLMVASHGLAGMFLLFREIATSPGPLNPEEVGLVVSTGMILGLVGSVATFFPAIIGILALARNVRPPGPERT